MFGFNFGVTPQQGIALLKKGVCRQLGLKDVDAFEMFYNAKDEKIFFVHKSRVIPYDSEGIQKIFYIVKKMLAAKLKDGESIELINLEYETAQSVFTICLTDKAGNKSKQMHQIKNDPQ